MKLRYININGFGVLVDEGAEIKKGDWFYSLPRMTYHKCTTIYDDILVDKTWENRESVEITKIDCVKIISAEKELNLDVPQLNWREWEVEQLAKKEFESIFSRSKVPHVTSKETFKRGCINGFIAGYNQNKRLYTEEDLRKVIQLTIENCSVKRESNRYVPDVLIDEVVFEGLESDIIQSLQKFPKCVVLEREQVIKEEYKTCSHVKEVGCIKDICTCYFFKPKLIINPQNKQEVIIKEIIY